MRILSFIIAFGFALTAPSANATTDSTLPGVGAFNYSGSQLDTHTTTTIAHLTLTPRGKQFPASAQGSTNTTARG